jgi:uncharacterized protein
MVASSMELLFMRFNILFMSVGLAVPQVQAQQSSVSSPYLPTTQIRTTATATRAVPPDLAVARFEFSARGSSMSDAARAASATGEAIRRAVTKMGIPEDSILGRGSLAYPWDQSSQMEIKPNAEFKRYDTTYVFRDLMEVHIHDLRRVAKALDAALAAGAQKLTILQFSSRRVQQAGQEALVEAAHQARRNAELMADAAGGRVGRPLELTTEKSSAADAFYDLRSTNLNTGTSQTTYGITATPPSAELRVSVYGRWELLPSTDSLPHQ